MSESAKPFAFREMLGNITPTNEIEARAHLSDALHNYISVVLEGAFDGQPSYLTPSNFVCLITCQFVCAGKLGEKCISHSLREVGAVRVLQGVVTLGRLLNAERNLQC